MTDAGGRPEPDRTEEFVQLLTEHQRRLYVYIFSLLGSGADADEVLQETNLALWRKLASFEPGSNFSAWACRVAYFEVLALRKRRGRDRLSFDPELLRTLAAESADHVDSFETRRRALSQCMAKLSAKDRDLLARRYECGNSAAAVAEQLGRTAQATYQALHRIRTSLSLCIRRTLAAEEQA